MNLRLATAAWIGAASLLPVAILPSPAEAKAPTDPCVIIRTLRHAGFTGNDLHVAWAVVMRESGGDSRQVTNGRDFGLFQINRPTHPQYRKSDLLRGIPNARIAYRIVQREGWRPWGLNRSGTAVDARDYAGIWSSDRISAWIWEPYAYWRDRYPTRCGA